MKNRLFFVLIISHFCFFLQGQSFFNLSIGADFTHAEIDKFSKQYGIFYIKESGFSKKSLSFDINYNHELSHNFFGSIGLYYTPSKTFNTRQDAFFSTQKVYLSESYRFDVGFKYFHWKYFYLGTGHGINYTSKSYKNEAATQVKMIWETSRIELSWMILGGLNYKGFFLESNYANGYAFARSKIRFGHIKPIDTISLHLGYSIVPSKLHFRRK
jgi:hypothetical protein